MIGDEKRSRAKFEAMVVSLNTILSEIYHNKSSDEYKMKGDITKSSSYKNIEQMIANLTTLKRFPKQNASDLRQMFTTLHLPVFKTLVKEYMMEVNDRNTTFTVMFTIGYRLLIGELSRIYTSTEAMKNGGIVYNPDKVSRKNDASAMIKVYSSDLEQKLDRLVRSNTISQDKQIREFDLSSLEVEEENTEPVQEGVALDAITAVAAKAPTVGKLALRGVGAVAGLFKNLTSFISSRNPIAEIDFMFMKSYEDVMDQFDNVCALYNSTKEAYTNYMKLPDAKRNPKVEERYKTEMEKYNIQMQDLHAKIEHFNQRAEKEADEEAKKTENNLPKTTPPAKTDNDNNDDDFQF